MKLPWEKHKAEFCVVGGGMAGLAASLSAARHGAKVILMHDRPVLGGNSSSECRVHITGADRAGGIPHLRETGILEELRLANLERNPQKSFSIWDTILYEKTQKEENLTTLLNCSCQDVKMDNKRIRQIQGWQFTSQTYHIVEADIFADCSGDAILAPLSGAKFSQGREGQDEYDETFAPEKADKKTMGMTCLFQGRKHEKAMPFEPMDWAYKFDKCEDLPYGDQGHQQYNLGYWWIELGGDADQIHDTESLRDELLKIVYGVWDHIKNRCKHREKAKNWALEWIGFLPAKRESRRYVGPHVLSQKDIESGGQFDDIVAYGGWPMDDHNPNGFWSGKKKVPPTIFHPAPSPYGIPYRTLYSKDIENLMFAGRCHSATHMAMSSTRVMGTCSVMGQAVGTAAAIAVREGIDPEEVGRHMDELQGALLRDDCYLPGVPQRFSELTEGSELTASQGNPEPVRDGFSRQVEDNPHCWMHSPGDWIAYTFNKSKKVKEISLILDTAMEIDIQMHMTHSPPGGWELPAVIPKTFVIEGRRNNNWETLLENEKNAKRLVRIPINQILDGIRYRLLETWGAEKSRLYAFYID